VVEGDAGMGVYDIRSCRAASDEPVVPFALLRPVPSVPFRCALGRRGEHLLDRCWGVDALESEIDGVLYKPEPLDDFGRCTGREGAG